MVKNPFTNAGDAGLIPGSGDEMTTHSGILAWEIPWTEKLGRLQSTGLQRADETGGLSVHLYQFTRHFHLLSKHSLSTY